MSLITLLIIFLVCWILFSYPRWGYNQGWGYGPMGGVGLIILVIVIILLLNGGGHRIVIG